LQRSLACDSSRQRLVCAAKPSWVIIIIKLPNYNHFG
jgi:hypothetical protein